MDLIFQLLRLSGLSLAAACSPSLTLLMLTVLAHQGVWTLPAGLGVLASDGAVLVAGVLAIATIVATKVLPLRKALQTLELPLILAIGGLAFASQPSPFTDVHVGLALAIGALLSGIAAGLRFPLRLLRVLPSVALVVEWMVGLVLLATALAAPVLLPFVLLVGIALLWFAWRLVWRTAARLGTRVGEQYGTRFQEILGPGGSSGRRPPAPASAASTPDWLSDEPVPSSSFVSARRDSPGTASEGWLEGRW